MLLYLTRRRLLAATALGAAGLVLDDVLAEPLAPTPQCHDGDAPTVRQTEGPYFKPSSPQRADLVEPNSKARLIELGGQVLTRSCRRSSVCSPPSSIFPTSRRTGATAYSAANW